MTHRLTRAARPLCAASFLVAILCAGGAPSATPSATKTSVPTTALKAGPETALQRIQRMVLKINDEAKTPDGEAAVVKRLSGQLGASEDSLRHQHETWGLGYGEIAMAYGFAKASRKGKRPADVVEMRNSGKNWDAIAKDLGVKVDAVAKKMRRNVAPTPPPEPRGK